MLIFLRYTGSRTIWLQQLGRGLRKTKNKEYVHVLDFVGSLERLNEVKQFAELVKNISVDNREFEGQTEERNYHDFTIEVNYNKSAAEVLQLIEELKYRLHSRDEAIRALRNFYEINAELPSFEQIENVMPSFTCDQISTLFDSYYGFIKAALDQEFNSISLKARLETYVKHFFQSNKVLPSYRAISLANQHNGLLLCTETECKHLLGPLEILFETNCYESKSKNKSEKFIIKEKLNEKTNDVIDKNREFLIEKYIGVISSPKDLLSLHSKVRAEIRKNFKSEFLF